MLSLEKNVFEFTLLSTHSVLKKKFQLSAKNKCTAFVALIQVICLSIVMRIVPQTGRGYIPHRWRRLFNTTIRKLSNGRHLTVA